MKYHLFIDNFRGFRDTCIPITDVNFLVGENSTGKSSILGLLKLLSGPQFLLGEELRDEHVAFGQFSDIVSAHSDDRSYFRIGLVSESLERRRKLTEKVATGCLLTFQECRGQPRLFKCTFCRGQEKVSLKFGKAVHYKRGKLSPAPTTHQIIAMLRSQWINEHAPGRDEGYRKLSAPAGFGDRVPLLIALTLASDVSRSRREAQEFPPYLSDAAFAPPHLTWFGPIRTKPKRTYDELTLDFSPEGQHTPYLIRRMLHSRSQATRLRGFIEKVGEASGLFQDVRTKSFGRGATARFELDIVLDGKALNILNVGYGVSQALPIIVEVLARPRGTWFAIQEPEIHLHPRAQAALGDAFFEMAAIDRKRFLVETHSDFAIDRFRMNYKNGRSDKPDSQILFFERREKRNVVTSLPIGRRGELPADQPESYRRFFVREQMNLLGI